MVNKLFVQFHQVSESVEAKIETRKQQQKSPVNFIWGEPVHAENLGGAQV
tara:strand:- start:1 stop:150 length:150 start_codon:yes stop_codon:yes gene_type:complete